MLDKRKNTAEEVEQKRAFWQELLTFIGANCEITPCWGALKISRRTRAEQAKLLDGASLDAVLLATEPGRALLSDDAMLRGLAGAEFGVAGIWTQAVMLKLQGDGFLAERKYAEATLTLVTAGFTFVTINGEVLLVSAERDAWAPGEGFRKVTRLLAASNVEFRSAVAAATDFIGRLWNSPATEISRNALLMVLLNALSSGRRRQMVAKGVERALRVRLQLAPTVVRETVAVLRVWEATNLV